MAIDVYSQDELMAMGMYRNLPPKKILKVPGDEKRVKGTLEQYTSNEDGVDKSKIEIEGKVEKLDKKLENLEGKLDKLVDLLSGNKE